MTLWGLRDQEAGWVGADLVNNNGTHDLGVFQINSSWVPRLSQIVGRSEHRVSELLRYDPCFNAEVARWIFLSILHKFRDYWKAVGMYHSLTVWRQMHYVNGVKYHLKRRNWNVGF
nr:lytic transglycosylase domain-containing protein [Novosphingobium sp. SG707]